MAERGRLEVVDKSSSKYIDGELSKRIAEAEATLGDLIAGHLDARSLNPRSLKQAQEALRESDKRYRLMIETDTAGIWIWDREDQLVFANPRIAKMLGYSVSEMVGHKLGDFLHETSQKAGAALLSRFREGGKVQADFKFRRKDGKGSWAILSATPMIDPRGHYLGAFAIITDITRRKLAETTLQETNELLENIISNTSTAIAYIDREFNFIRVNRAFAAGYAREISDFTGKNFFDLFPSDSYRIIFHQVIDTGKPFFEVISADRDRVSR